MSMQRSGLVRAARALASRSRHGLDQKAASGARGLQHWLHAGTASRFQCRGFATNEFVAAELAKAEANALHDETTAAESTPLNLLSMDIQHRDYISLRWSDGHKSKFHLIHLRTWCPCPSCQHSTGQRLINGSDVDPALEIKDMFVKGETLTITWNPDGHTSTYPWSWLRENCYSSATLNRRANNMATKALAPGAPIPSVAYDDVMQGDDGVADMLHQLVEHGFVVIKGTPSVSGEVKKIAERVAPVSHAFLYGDTFDVVAEHNPVNIAYTNNHLRHHLDLAYYESPPGIQMLHALKFDASVLGGESTFVDVFAVAEDFRQRHPKHFRTLCRVPATFRKHHLERANPAVMEYQRPHIQLNHREEVVAVHWSPPFEGPLRVPFEDVQSYYEAYKHFYDIVEGGRFKVEFKLQEGDTVMFNQRRVLHGRNQFSLDSNGTRHLQGTYINIDDALCRFNVLRSSHPRGVDGTIRMNRRVGNGNFA